MSKLELGTFGSIVKFAMQIESDSLEIFSQILNSPKDDYAAQLFKRLIEKSSNRIKSLKGYDEKMSLR